MWRALDLEGENVAEEATGDVGARHRSGYRLCGALPGSVAVVISQDRGVRFVCQRGGRITYWEQMADITLLTLRRFAPLS